MNTCMQREYYHIGQMFKCIFKPFIQITLICLYLLNLSCLRYIENIHFQIIKMQMANSHFGCWKFQNPNILFAPHVFFYHYGRNGFSRRRKTDIGMLCALGGQGGVKAFDDGFF